MRSKFEQCKRLYIFIVGLALVLFPTLFFTMIWRSEINTLLYVDFKNKGNWLIIVCFAFILLVMLLALRGLKIGYYKMTSLVVSQLLALVCTHVIMSVQMILMVGQVALLGHIVCTMCGLLVINVVIDTFITTVFTKIYNRLLPPYRLLYVYGDHKNNLKAKVATRSDKYVIEQDIYYGEESEAIKQEILKYDGVVLNDIPSKKKNELLKYCFDNTIRVYFVPKISDIFVKGAEEINVFDTPIFLCKNTGLTVGQKMVKRMMDIAISGLMIIIVAIPMAIVAVAIKIEDGGPVVYSQKRCTLGGKEFMIHKFRSMSVDAESKNGAQLAKREDPRITKVGKFIRRTRLDELPQFVNILKGEMSFVGPRPERPEFVKKNCDEIPEFQYRMKVKAGLTGYAQVNGNYSTSFLDKLKLDLIYIEKYSILLDIQIVLMTLKVIFMKERAEGVISEETS